MNEDLIVAAASFNCGSSGKIRKLLDQDVADLEFMERSRENRKLQQALYRECIVEARVNELKQEKVGKKEWWQTVIEREQARPGVACFTRSEWEQKEEREQVGPGVASSPRVGTRQMKKEEREQAGPGVASIPGVETRQMKKARSS
jgi:hypothetical protein